MGSDVFLLMCLRYIAAHPVMERELLVKTLFADLVSLYWSFK